MKIAYFGGDWYLNCLTVFQQHGHQISHIFICDERPYNEKTRRYALENNLPIISSKPTSSNLQELENAGVDCLYSAEYSWIIPTDGFDFKSINMHPTLLPFGRGSTPLIWLLLKYRKYAGITFHQLAEKVDQGDIVFQKPLEINAEESWETLVAKLKINVPIILDELLSDFDHLYETAQAQKEGSYWPKIELSDRTINWNSTVAEIKQLATSCGRFGVVVNLGKETILVNHIQVSKCQHQQPPGTFISEDEATYVVAASDGIVVLIKHNIIEKVSN